MSYFLDPALVREARRNAPPPVAPVLFTNKEPQAVADLRKDLKTLATLFEGFYVMIDHMRGDAPLDEMWQAVTCNYCAILGLEADELIDALKEVSEPPPRWSIGPPPLRTLACYPFSGPRRGCFMDTETLQSDYADTVLGCRLQLRETVAKLWNQEALKRGLQDALRPLLSPKFFKRIGAEQANAAE